MNDVYNILENIQYGYIYEGKDISDDQYQFGTYYRLQSPDKLLDSKYGVCWDQVELERLWFEKNNYNLFCDSFSMYACIMCYKKWF